MSAPWIAGENSFDGKPTSPERAVLLDGLQAIFGAGGHITTGRRQQGRKDFTVEPYGCRHYADHYSPHVQPSNVVKLRLF